LQYLANLARGALVFRRDELENHGFVQDEEQTTTAKRSNLEIKEENGRKRLKSEL